MNATGGEGKIGVIPPRWLQLSLHGELQELEGVITFILNALDERHGIEEKLQEGGCGGVLAFIAIDEDFDATCSAIETAKDFFLEKDIFWKRLHEDQAFRDAVYHEPTGTDWVVLFGKIKDEPYERYNYGELATRVVRCVDVVLQGLDGVIEMEPGYFDGDGHLDDIFDIVVEEVLHRPAGS